VKAENIDVPLFPNDFRGQTSLEKSLVFVRSGRYSVEELARVNLTDTSCVISEPRTHEALLRERSTLIIVKNARLEFGRVLARFFGSASNGKPYRVGPITVQFRSRFEQASLGAGGKSPKVSIGSGVTAGPYTVIGGQGFGVETDYDGSLVRIPHLGGVEILGPAQIGSSVAIDRGTLGPTRIGRNAQIDNLVHIAHNVVIGDNVQIAAGAVVGGGSVIGNNSWVGPNATISNRVRVGQNCWIGIGSVVLSDLPDSSRVFGNPASPIARTEN